MLPIGNILHSAVPCYGVVQHEFHSLPLQFVLRRDSPHRSIRMQQAATTDAGSAGHGGSRRRANGRRLG